MTVLRVVLGCGLAALLAACANPARDARIAQREAAYRAAAGEPVKSFRFFDLYTWEPLNDTQLVVYPRASEAWLLDVDGGCRDLVFANTIGLTSNLHQVMVRFDKVLTGRRNFPCTIMQIRPVDLARFKAAQAEKRPVEARERGEAPAPAASNGY
ncbi:DUF6491 family protein [Frateuria defendens]|uniref:DUF6491 family protein n=1 Tax=Frateuria defendens TaxID=2219559 RepID=UPI00066FC115|nr:DUF6491 family protein [Frateuria defendens]